jgi:hypothetical protein
MARLAIGAMRVNLLILPSFRSNIELLWRLIAPY